MTQTKKVELFVFTVKAEEKDGEGKCFESVFTLTREDLDNKGKMALKSLDATEYLAQELKREYED